MKVVEMAGEDAENVGHGGADKVPLGLEDIGDHECVGEEPVGDGEDQPLDLLAGHGAAENVEHGCDDGLCEEGEADEHGEGCER
mmetsp:Transcript_35109/g.49871  ORF Transcript_35109/g.49871 Transcript_35109/m.49871 type:complete len:84 (+) Transcript_35109:397-648(+)